MLGVDVMDSPRFAASIDTAPIKRPGRSETLLREMACLMDRPVKLVVPNSKSRRESD